MRVSLPTNVRSGQRVIRWPDRFVTVHPHRHEHHHRVVRRRRPDRRSTRRTGSARRPTTPICRTSRPSAGAASTRCSTRRCPAPESLWALARLDGVPAGYLQLDLPQLDNTDNATAELMVHPELRRRGVGRALHEYGVRLLREHGRKRVVGDDRLRAARRAGPDVAGAAFAAVDRRPARAGRGAPPARRQPRSTGSRCARRWPRPGRGPQGYRSVCWQGATPQEYVAGHRLPGRPADDGRAHGRRAVGAGAGGRRAHPRHRAGAGGPGPAALPPRDATRGVRPAGRLDPAGRGRLRRLARVPADHHRRPGAPWAPARPHRQGREPAPPAHPRAGGTRASTPGTRPATATWWRSTSSSASARWTPGPTGSSPSESTVHSSPFQALDQLADRGVEVVVRSEPVALHRRGHACRSVG